MEEVCTCKGCGKQEGWIIFKDRLQCSNCKREVKFDEDVMASSLINLTNNNFWRKHENLIDKYS